MKKYRVQSDVDLNVNLHAYGRTTGDWYLRNPNRTRKRTEGASYGSDPGLSLRKLFVSDLTTVGKRKTGDRNVLV